MSRLDFEEVSLEDVPFEQMKGVLDALLNHLNLKIEVKRWYDGPNEYRVSHCFKTEKGKRDQLDMPK
jgi:hypothetical protein